MFTMGRINYASAKEQRLLHWFKEVGPNAKTWMNDVADTYVKQPVAERDPIKMIGGAVMAAASTVLEAPDYIFAGIADQKIIPPTGLRTTRDIGQLGKDIVSLKPIATVLDVLRLPGDLVLDAGDKLVGIHSHQQYFHSQIDNVMAKTSDTPLRKAA